MPWSRGTMFGHLWWTRGDGQILITLSFSCIILGVDVGTKRLRGILSFWDATAIAIPALPSGGGK